MIIWLDAHLSPGIAVWITATFDITAYALRDVGLRDAEDSEIFEAAKAQEAIIITKDSDFVDLANGRILHTVTRAQFTLIVTWAHPRRVFLPNFNSLYLIL